jgi:threonine/homoserine/homoserine lactone efflux protein
MEGAAGALILGFMIGLSGALVPGPTLVATISTSLYGGWTMGPKVTFGHALLETAIAVLIIGGISLAPEGYSDLIALIGGVALIAFGILTIVGSRNLTLPGENETVSQNPYIAGILTSAANPYFWIWWLSIGSVLLMEGLANGLFIAALFMIGHWGADLGWLTIVSGSIHRGRNVLSLTGYRYALLFCGVFLTLFGGYYLYSSGFIF